MFFHGLCRDVLSQSELDRLHQFAALTREVRSRTRQLLPQFLAEASLEKILKLRPQAPQIGLQKLHSLLYLGLDHLAEFYLDLHLQIAVGTFAAPHRFQCPPERKLAGQERTGLRRARST